MDHQHIAIIKVGRNEYVNVVAVCALTASFVSAVIPYFDFPQVSAESLGDARTFNGTSRLWSLTCAFL